MAQLIDWDVERVDAGAEKVLKIIEEWKSSYMHCIKLEEEHPTHVVFRTIWSKPTKLRPIPETVAHIFFTVVDKAERPIVTYNFEGQRLQHVVGRGAQFNEKWLDRIIEQKILIRNTFQDLRSEKQKRSDMEKAEILRQAKRKKVIEELQTKTHFDQIEVSTMYETFNRIAGEGGVITRDRFIDGLRELEEYGLSGLANSPLAPRLFEVFDMDGNTVIDLQEFVCTLSLMCKGSLEDKLRVAFNFYDHDGSGYIDKMELFKILQTTFQAAAKTAMALYNEIEDKESSSKKSREGRAETPAGGDAGRDDDDGGYMSESDEYFSEEEEAFEDFFSDEVIRDLVEGAFLIMDEDGDGKLNFDEFKTWVLQNGEVNDAFNQFLPNISAITA